MAGGAATTSPKVVFLKLRYLREFDILYSYSFEVDLMGEQPDGTVPSEAITNLNTISEAKKLVQFAYHAGGTADTKRVLIQTDSGPTGTANLREGRRRMTLLETTQQ